MQKIQGVTLIELVMTLTLAAILSTVVSVFITKPIIAYTGVTQRADLVQTGDLVLRRIARDIQRAVPNSVRVKIDPAQSQRVAIEFLNIVEGMRYRATPPGPFLDFTQPITTFNVIGQFQYATLDPTCSTGACRVVVYNTGANNGGAIPSDNPAPGANVYSTSAAPNCSGCLPPPGTVTISPVGTTVTLANVSGEGQVHFNNAVQFALPSPAQRVDFVDTPVTYLCDNNSHQLTRYWNYTIQSAQPTNPTLFPLNAAKQAPLNKNIFGCQFIYTPSTSQRNGIVSMSITLKTGGESITLMRQVGVSNLP